MTRDRDRDDRPSWREIDQRRDRPRRDRRPPRPLPKKQADWVRKLALRQAEALFQGKRGRPEYQQALKEMEAAHGTKKFVPLVKKFLEEYGLPEEWGTLNLLLDFPDPQVVLQVLHVMAAQAPQRSRVEQQGFRGKLQVLALTSPQDELRRGAEDLLATL